MVLRVCLSFVCLLSGQYEISGVCVMDVGLSMKIILAVAFPGGLFTPDLSKCVRL